MKRTQKLVIAGALVGVLALAVVAQRWLSEPGLDLPAGIPAPAAAEAVVFLAVGRQGYGNAASFAIADAMERVAAERPPHFVALAGDNFCPRGVRSVRDPLWVERFERLYDGPHLLGTAFFAVPGNHDQSGDIVAQFDYGKRRRGTGRWCMDGHFYKRDFGRADGDRVLLRVLFIDTGVLRFKDAHQGLAEIDRLRNAPGDPVWTAVVGHFPLRSLSEEPFTVGRILGELLPRFAGDDIYISANDRFQQVIDRPGEPLHVSTSGGGDKIEGVPFRDADGQFTLARQGFARVIVEHDALSVHLYDSAGQLTHSASRTRPAAPR